MTEEIKGDGRHNRRKRSRERIIGAAFLLVQRGNWRPSVVEIAAQAGVSVRTVFDIFGSLNDVYEELMRGENGADFRRMLLRIAQNDASNWNHILHIIFMGRLPVAVEQQGEPV